MRELEKYEEGKEEEKESTSTKCRNCKMNYISLVLLN